MISEIKYLLNSKGLNFESIRVLNEGILLPVCVILKLLWNMKYKSDGQSVQMDDLRGKVRVMKNS